MSDKQYFTTIGLEIHAELNTKSKMFCGCKNDPDEENPNTNICPVCMAHPGSLPVINKEAVFSVIKVGLALNGQISEDFTEFDRKNYFYPDIPKAYQISQYKYPIVGGGNLKGIDITRIHLEEDTATSKHDRGDYSLVDFNRAGVPLMELVTEPVIHSAEEAGNFARELQLLLRYLNVSEANMEKGQMRVELNISVSDDPKKFGTKVEVKNINSFKAVERAAKFETERMIELLDAGKGSEIVQETRGWDETKQITFSQRSKENAQDYRYFPDPDLPKLVLKDVFDIADLRKNLPELPDARRIRYSEQFGIKAEDVENYINDFTLAGFFEDVVTDLKGNKEKIKLASNYISSDLIGFMKKDSTVEFPHSYHFAELIEMLSENLISSRGAKELLILICKNDESPRKLAEDHGLIQKNNSEELESIIRNVIENNTKVIEEYKSGKEASLQFLIGQVMKESKGSANPGVAKQLLIDMLARP